MKRKGKVRVQRNRDGGWFWKKIAGNGEIEFVAQAYSTKGNAVRQARKVGAKNGIPVEVVE